MDRISTDVYSGRIVFSYFCITRAGSSFEISFKKCPMQSELGSLKWPQTCKFLSLRCRLQNSVTKIPNLRVSAGNTKSTNLPNFPGHDSTDSTVLLMKVGTSSDEAFMDVMFYKPTSESCCLHSTFQQGLVHFSTLLAHFASHKSSKIQETLCKQMLSQRITHFY